MSRATAIEAGNRELRERYGYEAASGRPEDAYWVHALDAAHKAGAITFTDEDHWYARAGSAGNI